MIHISIPSFQTLLEKHEPHKKYHVYDLHVNGAYHASVRYSALFSLHEKLVQTFGLRLNNAEFPPKRIWKNLDEASVNRRRDGLAKYLQAVIHNPDICTHPVLERTFLDFQVASFMPAINGVKLEIFLPDGNPTHVECRSDDSTSVVVKKLAKHLGILEHDVPFFGLFLTKDWPGEKADKRVPDGVFDQVCVRWLKNFESPFASQQLINREDSSSDFKLCIRRTTWDPSVEEHLLDDAAALRVLYLQASNDLQRGRFVVSDEIRSRLTSLQEEGSIKEFMRVCHRQASYGYEQLSPVRSDYPEEGNKLSLKVGRRQIVFEWRQNNILSQLCIRSTRIRVWRVSHTDETAQSGEMTFQVEYLVGTDDFQKITLQTDQAVLLSLFLQSVASEILRDQMGRLSPTYKFDDQTTTRAQQNLDEYRSKSVVDSLTDTNSNPMNGAVNGALRELFRVYSRQMPLGDDRFDELTDVDL